MIAGARVDVAPYKRDPMDFVLWKPSNRGEPSWASPSDIRTPGRPGWHIECSAMSWKHLGETFDIHGGGIDLVFPHHENEIAQSCCAFHTERMASIWMHNGFLQVEGEKMSKSLGNFVTIREVLADWPGDVARLAMLSSHYRQPINWTVKGLEEAEKALASFFDAASAEADPRPAPAVLEALSDDLNTPKAIAEMHGLKNAAGRKALAGTLAFFGFRAEELGGVARPACAGAGASGDGHREPDRRPQRRPRRKGFQGIRPHPRRARDARHHAEGFQGRHDLGGRAMMAFRNCGALRSAPSPLAGEGWGGGWLLRNAFACGLPPSRPRFARSTSPARGEVKEREPALAASKRGAMMARANPTLGLRPMLPADTPMLAAIFRAAIEELTEDDYNPSQQEAWASAADDEDAFGRAAWPRISR